MLFGVCLLGYSQDVQEIVSSNCRMNANHFQGDKNNKSRDKVKNNNNKKKVGRQELFACICHWKDLVSVNTKNNSHILC